MLHRYVLHRAAAGGRQPVRRGRRPGLREPGDLHLQGRLRQLLQLLQVYNTAAIEAEAQGAIRPEAIALGVFGLIAGLAALIIGAQSVSRQIRTAADDTDILRALGAGPAATAADGTLGVLAAVVAGALTAGAVTVGLSPFSLFGPVRQAEPGRGVYVDWTVLGLGMIGLVVVLGAITAVSGYRQAPHRAAARAQPAGRGSALVRVGLGGGLGASGVAGLRFALEPGRGRTAVPVRSVLTGAVLAVIVVSVTLTFGASLSYLISRPALYGWDFSYALYSTDGWGPFPAAQTAPLLHRDKQIAATTGVYFLTVQINGQTVPAILSPARPAIGPRILDRPAGSAAPARSCSARPRWPRCTSRSATRSRCGSAR